MKKDLLRKIFISFSAFAIISMLFFSTLSFAADPPANSSKIVSNPLKVTSIVDFISLVLTEVVKVGAVLCVLALVYVGFLFVKARGSDSELTKAKEALWGTIIGIALLLGAQIIASIIKGTTDALTK